MKEIPLSQGKVALVDDNDYERVSKYKWSAILQSNDRWRAVRNSGKNNGNKSIYMHRFIMDAGAGQEVDHINGNPLDNRRDNIRLCTHSDNLKNCRTPKNNSSGYKGVSLFGNGKKFRVRVGGKHIGVFDNADTAARAYDGAAREVFGEFASLNFP